MKLTVAAVSAPALSRLREFLETWEQTQSYPIFWKLYYIAESNDMLQAEDIRSSLAEADVAVVDAMGASAMLNEIIFKGLQSCSGTRIVIGNVHRELNRLGSFSMDSMKMMGKKKEDAPKKEGKSAVKTMRMIRRMAMLAGSVIPTGMTRDMKNLFTLIDYWQQATEQDIASFMHLILRSYFGQKQLPKEKAPTIRYGIYLKDPESMQCWDSVSGYAKSHRLVPGRETVALLFYGHVYPNDFYPVVAALYRELGKRYNVLPIAFSQNEDKDLETLEKFLMQEKYPIAAAVNTMPFRLGAGPMGGNAEAAAELLKKRNVPYFKPFCITKCEKQVWETEEALNAGEFLIHIMLPELDGGLLTYPVGIIAEEAARVSGVSLTAIEPMESRITQYVRRVGRYIALQKKPNSEKRVAVVCYNYPPGEDNLLGGALLDTLESLPVLLKAMKAAGYRVTEKTAEELKAYFTDGHGNAPEWCEKKPEFGLELGNVLIGVQPLRAEHMNADSYHDKNRRPPKAYTDFYEALQGYDAILHFGTHGTLEFLPGKENGISESCWCERILGDVPHFYYYYMGNPSEAMIAKRRSNACLISYAPPAFVPGTTAYTQLRAQISEYREALQMAPERSHALLESIANQASAIGMTEGSFTAKELPRLEDALECYEESLIPDGLHIMDETEAAGILKALNGEYLEAAPGGDVLKNNRMLPAGRNLVQFDPRLVPTAAAADRGAKIARETLEQYREKHGTYPNSCAVIAWGLEVSKTQGETIGQIMEYLGIRLADKSSSYESRLQIIPAKELSHPRMDVVIHICGFFRDMYPNLLNDLNEIFRLLDEQDEPDAVSLYAKNTRALRAKLLSQGMDPAKAAELARSRIFGPKEGEYGTRLTDSVHSGRWQRETELADLFTGSLSYVYTATQKGTAARELLGSHYQNVELMSQVRNNVEYELVDLDHYFEFYGGLAKSIETVKGSLPEMLVADSVGSSIHVMDVQTSLSKGIQTRVLNPKWIEGMMKHDYHGVNQISKRFENIVGFAATTGQVRSETFSQLEKTYVADEALRTRMQESNKWGYLSMLKRLAEANNRGYWNATEEELELLQDVWMETEGSIE